MTEVIFRVDASYALGVGHVMRCLALAQDLLARGARITFLCRAHVGHLQALIEQRGIDVALLPAPEPGMSADPLGTSLQLDARQTLDRMPARPEWLVVDHYGIDATWEARVRPHVGRILVIDDLADRRHDCDVLVDQNLSLRPGRYDRLLPDSARQFLGPRFALLGREYRRASARNTRADIGRILVSFGGSDPSNLTAVALRALSSDRLRSLHVDVVVGVNHRQREELRAAASARPRTTVWEPQRSLAGLMEAADLAIGAGGITSWERMCLGLPGIVVSIAENQRPGCLALAAEGLIYYAGHQDDVQAGALAELVLAAAAHPDERIEMGERGRACVDGWGAARVADAILPAASDQLALRPARPDDVYQYFAWVNDPDVRAQSNRTGPIDFAHHRAWFAEQLAHAENRLLMMECDGMPVGQIRFTRRDDAYLINYSVDAIFRGRGWGARLVQLGLATWREPGSPRFLAEVKHGNQASAAVFERLGFVEVGSGPALRVFERRAPG